MINCLLLKNFYIKAKSIKGKCKLNYKSGDFFTIEKIVPKSLCPLFYHTIVPYISALKNNVKFNIPEKNFIIVQCPNTDIGITAKIFKYKTDKIKIEIIDNPKKDCPYFKFNKSDFWLINNETQYFCRQAYDSIFPYLIAFSCADNKIKAKKEKKVILTCSSYPNYITFEIGSL
jgi:uncharacterized repeat protein (TIGR04076 family)